MGYPVRAYVEGYWYHVYSRGQREEPLFFSPEDRKTYLRFLDDELDRRGGAIGSFCLMTTHSHLLLRMGAVSLGKILRNAHSNYARYFNAHRDTKGHVTQKRPGVKVILDPSYLWTLVGYIHRNPIEASMVNTITEYQWSSWYWFEDAECDWIDLTSWLYPPVFEGKEKRDNFRAAVDRGDHDWPGGQKYVGTQSEWDQFRSRRQEGRGAQAYKEKRGRRSKLEIAQDLASRKEVSVEKLKGPGRSRDVSSVRHRAMALMYQEGHGTSEIARWFNRTPAMVSKAYKQWKEQE